MLSTKSDLKISSFTNRRWCFLNPVLGLKKYIEKIVFDLNPADMFE